ncbi:hypothetical protein B0H16DRAFT_1452737 [Mycena metata]|uniref:Uncharacterized protein n=1 Tax=Mycena metata TaxID=1033252 RepID=A0AAD7NPE5_9AGAR|nr:hypothetical protein B0H16DRAFT_1452737 [Mycena metata]
MAVLLARARKTSSSEGTYVREAMRWIWEKKLWASRGREGKKERINGEEGARTGEGGEGRGRSGEGVRKETRTQTTFARSARRCRLDTITPTCARARPKQAARAAHTSARVVRRGIGGTQQTGVAGKARKKGREGREAIGAADAIRGHSTRRDPRGRRKRPANDAGREYSVRNAEGRERERDRGRMKVWMHEGGKVDGWVECRYICEKNNRSNERRKGRRAQPVER